MKCFRSHANFTVFGRTSNRPHNSRPHTIKPLQPPGFHCMCLTLRFLFLRVLEIRNVDPHIIIRLVCTPTWAQTCLNTQILWFCFQASLRASLGDWRWVDGTGAPTVRPHTHTNRLLKRSNNNANIMQWVAARALKGNSYITVIRVASLKSLLKDRCGYLYMHTSNSLQDWSAGF